MSDWYFINTPDKVNASFSSEVYKNLQDYGINQPEIFSDRASQRFAEDLATFYNGSLTIVNALSHDANSFINDYFNIINNNDQDSKLVMARPKIIQPLTARISQEYQVPIQQMSGHFRLSFARVQKEPRN